MVKQTIKASLRAEKLTFLPEPMLLFMEKQISILSHSIKETHIMSVTNSVNLIGRVAVAPTLRTVEGVDYVDTRIAIDLGYKTKDGQQASTFAPITISRPVPKQGESNQARRFLDWADKGALIAVEGEFRQGNKFVGKDGSDRYGEHYIRVNNFQILETKATAEARRAQASAQEAK